MLMARSVVFQTAEKLSRVVELVFSMMMVAAAWGRSAASSQRSVHPTTTDRPPFPFVVSSFDIH
jgi:hypothetical protein